jgi:hypothetical protein
VSTQVGNGGRSDVSGNFAIDLVVAQRTDQFRELREELIQLLRQVLCLTSAQANSSREFRGVRC